MLDLKLIRSNPDVVKRALKNRGYKNTDIVDTLLDIDEKRRKLLLEIETLFAQRNKVSDEIGKLMREQGDAQPLKEKMKGVSDTIKELSKELDDKQSEVDAIVLTIPNLPHESIPVGDEKANKILRTWGTAKKFDFKPITHMELGERLDILDLPRAAKITGSNFVVFKGAGAKLQRALIDFMLDLHTTQQGYKEIWAPALVNRASMQGTGQLPKLEEDMYRLQDPDDLFLIPTAEVPVTNLLRDEIIEEKDLPVYFTAYTPCFRKEAGSYGKDTKGLIRVHQFDKVEMVKFVKPETSFDELEKLLADAESVLQALELPYRVKLLASGDIGFSASKCYDLEAYAPGLDAWLEVSSCSNFCDFQARRANIRYRSKEDKKTNFVHTLNGSGVALARTVIAILENYQQKDGSIKIPQALRGYFAGKETLA